MNMNISTGGPHILFFERDSSLMALLISEFQLAGYECHTARTAVEVFDAIARHPIRVVLVNLAQAAAGRREFWVALDTQRRGRGVQVFTYQCYNLAGYGPRETDERSSSTVADLEIDGMLGLMNLVERIRERVPVGSVASNGAGTVSRLSRTGSSSSLSSSQSFPTSSAPSSPVHTPPMDIGTGNTLYRNGTAAMGGQMSRTDTTLNPAATHVSNVDDGQQSYSEKIRAVLYSNPRSTSPSVSGQDSFSTESSMLQQLAYGQGEVRESGLAQLSRMVQEYRPPLSDDTATMPVRHEGVSIASQPLRASPIEDLPLESAGSAVSNDAARRSDMGTRTVHATNGYTAYNGQVSSQDGAIGTPLASISNTLATLPPTQAQQTFPVTEPISPARPTIPMPAVTATTPLPAMRRQSVATSVQGLAQPTPSTQSVPPARTSLPTQDDVEARPETGQIQADSQDAEETTIYASPSSMQASLPRSQTLQPQQVQQSRQPQQAIQEQAAVQTERKYASPVSPVASAMPVFSVTPGSHPVLTSTSEVDEVREEEHSQDEEQAALPHETKGENSEYREHGEREEREVVSRETALSDMMQSLSAASSAMAQAQPPVINGRTMRSLGSVLLEGHLVPQSRLEVAQNIQRMLRGVDLRYELGEILLMFKLLTPDQLLAATLVSHGLISTQQISALSRIRQELHSIGLEYDLESLLILFRMLTPEQLREARTSWQG